MPVNPVVAAYVGLGSNLGDRSGNIAAAVERLRSTRGVVVTAVSSLRETDAVGGPPGSPPFLNGAVALQTSRPAAELLHCLQGIEADVGRIRTERWGPRVLDLDLLLFGNHSIAAPALTVPHPLMHLRRFVLEPLAEIAPYAVHPTSGKTVAALLAQIPL